MPIRPLPQCGAPGCEATSRNYTYKGGPGLCSAHVKRMRLHGTLETPESPFRPRLRREPPPPTMADNGCQFAPSCLRCHLPVCVEDMTTVERHKFMVEMAE